MATNNLPAVIPQPNLADLAAIIREAHQNVMRAAGHIETLRGHLLDFALTAGDALIAAKDEVKKKLGHGHWLEWLEAKFKTECDLSEDSAEVYMRLARNRKTLEANSEHARNLSLRGALKLLRSSKSTSKSWPRLPRAADVVGWLNTSSITECRCVFDAVGRKRMGQMIPPGWGMSLVAAGEVTHLHARIAELEAEVRQRDLTIKKLQRQLPASDAAEANGYDDSRELPLDAHVEELRDAMRSAGFSRPPQRQSASGAAEAPAKKPNGRDNWRDLPLDALEARIDAIRRSAADRHLSPSDWKQLDRMRGRAHELRWATSSDRGNGLNVSAALRRAPAETSLTANDTPPVAAVKSSNGGALH